MADTSTSSDDLSTRLTATERDRDEQSASADEMLDRLIKKTLEKNAAYEERNRVVAALARLFPSGLKRTDIPGWDAEWHGCVYVDLPTGQASWHFHDSQAHLFDGLPPYEVEWDGHDTDEKYRRVAALVSAPTEAARGLAVTEEMVELLRWAANTLYEINPSNYDHDEVMRLNDASVEVSIALSRALKKAKEAALCTSPPETVGGGAIIEQLCTALRLVQDDVRGKTSSCGVVANSTMHVIHRALEAVLSSAPPAEETWQAIETAPRDGTEMLVGWTAPSTGQWQYIVASIKDDRWDLPREYRVLIRFFSHWRPLPPAPAGEAK